MNLERALGALGQVSRCSPSVHETSSPLLEVDIVQADGAELSVLVKRLDRINSRKPAFLRDPAREIEAYRLLADENLGTPRCYASGRWWVALEKLEADALWQRAEIECWAATARWAARLHGRFRARSLSSPHLLRHDEPFYRVWFTRARAMVGESVEALWPATEAAIARLADIPSTLIHGELYPSNVLIDGRRVAAVDWETAGSGPGVIDLAALLTGWEGDSRSAIADAYGSVDRLDLAAAQLVLALQWLGWAADWQPPPEHRRDWLIEAQAAAAVLT